MSYKLKTAPAVEIVSTGDMKNYIKLHSSITADDTLILALVKGSRQWAEEYTRRGFITQTWELYLDSFPVTGDILLLKNPVQSVTSIKYYDVNNELQTLESSPAVYDVDTVDEPGRIRPALNESWPVTYNKLNAVIIEFKVGYGDAATDVPQDIVKAVEAKVNHDWTNRGEDGRITYPKAIYNSLDMYRLFRF